MALVLCLGAAFLGNLAAVLRRIGISARTLLGFVAALLLMSETALVFHAPIPVIIPWCIIAAVGAATVLSYTALAEYFPKELAGRANGALNVLHIGTAFIIQTLVGLIAELWPKSIQGRYPIDAYNTAFLVAAFMLLLSLVWFLWPVEMMPDENLVGLPIAVEVPKD